MFGAHGSLKNVLSNNKTLLRKKSLFKKEGLFIGQNKYDQKSSKGDFDFNKVSEKELEFIKRNIQKKSKSDNLKLKIAMFFLIAIGVFFSFLYFQNLKINQANQAIKEREIYIEKHIDRFSYLLKDGDNWLKKGKYYNAIFQYQLAIKIFPQDSVAKHKLLKAYKLMCLNFKKDCEKKYRLQKELKKNNPNTQRNTI